MRVCVPPPDGHARIVFILAALAALPLDAQQDPPTVRAVLGGTLIDGTGAPPVPGATVVIEGEPIVCAGPAAACPVPDGARSVDAAGRWVIPGLIDTHVHLFWRPEPRGEEWGHGRNGDALRRRLAQGVTTIREASTHGGERQTLALRPASHVAEIPWPRIYVSGRVDDRTIERLGVAGAGELTRWLIELGVDGIKIRNGLTLDDVVATVEEARRHGRPVYGHASDFDERGNPVYTMDDAVRAGVIGKMHIGWDAPVDPAGSFPVPAEPWGDHNQLEWWQALDARWLYADSTRQAERIQLMVERGVWLEPTLSVGAIVRDLLGLPEPAPAVQDTIDRIDAAIHAFIRQFHEAGGLVLAGTDHWEIHDELRALVNVGLSPMAVLQAATLNSARALGWDDRIGTIEPGKLVDLVILDADPLEDIDNARRVWRVMKGGIVYDPEKVVNREALREGGGATELRRAFPQPGGNE